MKIVCSSMSLCPSQCTTTRASEDPFPCWCGSMAVVILWGANTVLETQQGCWIRVWTYRLVDRFGLDSITALAHSDGSMALLLPNLEHQMPDFTISEWLLNGFRSTSISLEETPSRSLPLENQRVVVLSCIK